jgi:hypothetical protein
MKKSFYVVFGTVCLILAVVSRVNVWAADFSVNNVVEFQNALTVAQSNGEHDTINVASGTYSITSSSMTLGYKPTENFSLIIVGAGTGATILEGGRSVQILNIRTSDLADDRSAEITIKNLTFKNTDVSSGSYDIAALEVNTNSADITLEWSEFVESGSSSLDYRVDFDSVDGKITLTNNVFNNLIYYLAPVQVQSDSGPIILKHNTFTNNSGDQAGGAKVFSNSGTIILQNNIFDNNFSGSGGGGVTVATYTSPIILTSNTFKNNNATPGGANVRSIDNGPITLTNNVFYNNDSDNQGGGAWVTATNGTVDLTNNTFTDNFSPAGGGVYVSGGNTVNIYNNIFWGNTRFSDGWGADIDVYSPNAAVNVFNNVYDDFSPRAGNLSQGNNINQDPLLSSDFHLNNNSPCIDIGDNNAPGIPSTDFEGDQRIVNGTVDVGADEVVEAAITDDEGSDCLDLIPKKTYYRFFHEIVNLTEEPLPLFPSFMEVNTAVAIKNSVLGYILCVQPEPQRGFEPPVCLEEPITIGSAKVCPPLDCFIDGPGCMDPYQFTRAYVHDTVLKTVGLWSVGEISDMEFADELKSMEENGFIKFEKERPGKIRYLPKLTIMMGLLIGLILIGIGSVFGYLFKKS